MPRVNFNISKYFSLSENQKNVFSNVSWAVIGRGVDIVRALLIGILVARYLKPHDYGILNYTIGYVGMFSLLVELGMSGILVRELSKQKSDKNEIIGSAVAIRFVMSIAAIGFITLSVIFFENDPMLKVFIIINAFNLIFYSYSETLIAFFRAQLKNEYIIKAEIFKTVILIFIKLILLIIKAPLITFVIASSVDSFVIMFSIQYLFRKNYWSSKEFRVNRTIVKTLIWSSVPLFFEGIAAVFYQRIDIVMAGKFLDASYVGYYSVALKFIGFALFIPLVIAQTLAPLLVQKLESKDNDIKNEEYLLYKQKVADLIIVSGILISVFLFVVAKPVITTLYGPEYYQSVGLLQILAWKGLFSGLGYAGSVLIITEGRQKYVYIRNVIGGALNVGLNFLLIPIFGIKGVAFATIISYGVATYLANGFIPLYVVDFKSQTSALLFGTVRTVSYIKEILVKH